MKIWIVDDSKNKIAETEIKETVNGSEKQINWANSIKSEAISMIVYVIAKGNGITAKKETYEENIKKYGELLNRVNEITDAKTWIDNRSRTASEWIKSVR